MKHDHPLEKARVCREQAVLAINPAAALLLRKFAKRYEAEAACLGLKSEDRALFERTDPPA